MKIIPIITNYKINKPVLLPVKGSIDLSLYAYSLYIDSSLFLCVYIYIFFSSVYIHI